MTLAATLAVFPSIPLAGLTLLLGVDRFMAEARSITNLIGNAVATVVIARWEGAIDYKRAQQILQRTHKFTESADTKTPATKPVYADSSTA